MSGAASPDGLAVELRNVEYRLDGRQILSAVTFKVAPGETLILLGRSGSGKTTTLKLINRLLEPTSGEIFVEGRPQLEWDPIQLRRRIGYVIQDVGLSPHWTVEQNVGMVPRLESWPEARLQERVREMLGIGRLEFCEVRRAKAQRAFWRTAPARGSGPCTSGRSPHSPDGRALGALDPVTRAELQREFRELAARLEKAIVFVTQSSARGSASGHSHWPVHRRPAGTHLRT